MKTTTLLLSLLIALPLMGSEDNVPLENPFLHDDNFPAGYFLIPDAMPHFMGIYMKKGGMHKIEPTEEQETILEDKFASMVKFIMATAKEIKTLETTVTHAVVYEGKTAEELSESIDKIVALRHELTLLQIECLNLYKATLTPEQYAMIIDLAISEAQKK